MFQVSLIREIGNIYPGLHFQQELGYLQVELLLNEDESVQNNSR